MKKRLLADDEIKKASKKIMSFVAMLEVCGCRLLLLLLIFPQGDAKTRGIEALELDLPFDEAVSA